MFSLREAWRWDKSDPRVPASRRLEHAINEPAASDVESGFAAMVEDFGVCPSRIFQGVGQDCQAVESSLFIDDRRQFHHATVVPREHRVQQKLGRLERKGTNNVTQEISLGRTGNDCNMISGSEQCNHSCSVITSPQQVVQCPAEWADQKFHSRGNSVSHTPQTNQPSLTIFRSPHAEQRRKMTSCVNRSG